MALKNLPPTFCWSRIGSETGEDLATLVLRKEWERRLGGGRFLWGINQSLGSSAGYLSVLVLALYINGAASQMLYRRHEVLWLLTPLLLYWIGRVWLIARRGGMHDDPVVFALTDRVSLAVLAVFAVVIALAI